MTLTSKHLSYPINLIHMITDANNEEEFNRFVSNIVRETKINLKFTKEKKINIIDFNNIDDFERRIRDIIGHDSYIPIYRYKLGMTYEKISDVDNHNAQTILRRLDKIIRTLRHPDNRIRLVLDIDYEYYQNALKDHNHKESVNKDFDIYSSEFMNKNIRNLNCFSTRERSLLIKHKINTIKELATYTESELAGLPGVGATTIKHIKSIMEDYGIPLGS